MLVSDEVSNRDTTSSEIKIYEHHTFLIKAVINPIPITTTRELNSPENMLFD